MPQEIFFNAWRVPLCGISYLIIAEMHPLVMFLNLVLNVSFQNADVWICYLIPALMIFISIYVFHDFYDRRLRVKFPQVVATRCEIWYLSLIWCQWYPGRWCQNTSFCYLQLTCSQIVLSTRIVLFSLSLHFICQLASSFKAVNHGKYISNENLEMGEQE